MTELETEQFHLGEPLQKNDPYIWLHSGQKFYLSRPTEDMVELSDIAWSCSKLDRWNGHLKVHWSVADHQLLVTSLTKSKDPQVLLTALMHDAGEAYYGDLSSPLKSLFPEFRVWCRTIDKVIADKFQLIYPWPKVVTDADQLALRYENLLLMKYSYPALLPTETKMEVMEKMAPFLLNNDSHYNYLIHHNRLTTQRSIQR